MRTSRPRAVVCTGAYLLRSTSLYSPSERREADGVFARYRREGKPEEPVMPLLCFSATRMTEISSG
jgi:hypothetical protein